MKVSKQVLVSFLLLILIAALYRIMPGRQGLYGFSPQIAMAIFGGAVIKDKKLAFLLPLLSMFISDVFYEVLFRNGIGHIKGFYDGQLTNYIIFGSLTVFGFMAKNLKISRILLAALAAPVTFFLLSNFFVWLSSSPDAGYNRPKTFNGLMMCYSDGIPFFYPWSIVSTLLFSAVLFSGYYLFFKNSLSTSKPALA